MQSITECFPKIKKRARTLFVPYLLWNVILVLWFVVLQNLPVVSSMINSDVVGGIVGHGFLNGLYTMFIKPIAFQLWFLRDLIIYVFLTPLFFVAIKKLKWLIPFLLFIASWVGLIYLPSEIKIWGCFFFVLGGYVALHHSLEIVSDIITPLLASVAALLYAANAIVTIVFGSIIPGASVLFMLFGVVAIWRGYDCIMIKWDSKWISFLAGWGSYSFFVYCFHEPVFNIIKKIGVFFVGYSNTSLIVLYLLNPIVMLALSIFVAKVMQKYTPKVFSILTGGR